ncbi:MAG: Ig-like domain-containing protein [Oscillospiraceae bacterium]|nr:Ig-like domain-containing protein [Oscillospiraceae bacterium]
MNGNKRRRTPRLLAAFTALLMTAGIFGGCAGKSETPEESTAPEITAAETSLTETAPVSETETEAAAETKWEMPETNGERLITSVTADSMTGQLISTNSTFTVTASQDIPAESLKGLLALSNDSDFTLERTAPCSYKLKSLESFPENSMAVLSLVDSEGMTDYKWAFQTEGDVKVTHTYPTDGSEYAGVDTGIEITLTARAGTKNVGDYFEIEPPVKGKFTSHRNTLYFIPDKDLYPATYYTVKLKKGLPTADGDSLSEDYSFRFRTERYSGGQYLYDSGMSETFIEGDLAVIELYASDALKAPETQYSLKLYSYKTADDYYNALKSYVDSKMHEDSYEFSTDGLDLSYSSESSLIEGKDSWGPSFLLLPDDLKNGYYLAEVTAEADGVEYKVMRHIQVNPVSVYSAELGGDAQLFINDTFTGKAAEGAEAELYTSDGVFTAKADKDGLALLSHNTPAGGTGLLKITYNGSVFIDAYDYGKKAEKDPQDMYYTYIYTDREAYLTTDKVKIWGIVRPRAADVPMPEELYIHTYNYDSEIFEDVPVTLRENGTFTAEIDYSKSDDFWWANVALYSGDTELCSKGITVHDYEKPNYVYDITLPLYWESPQSEPVPTSIEASFYDGTPADGLHFKLSSYMMKSAEPNELVTDKDGIASGELLYKDVSENEYYYSPEWKPESLYVGYELTGVQDVYTYGSKFFWGFFRDIMLEYEFDKKTDRIDFTLSEIITDNITEEDSDSYYLPNDKIRGKAADSEINAVLKRRWYTKRETGSYYDYLQKKTVKNYEYDEHTETVKTYTLKTKNGKASIENLPLTEKDSTYYLEISYKDSKGRKTRQKIYLRGTEYDYYRDTDRKHYTLSSDKIEFKENESIQFTLLNNGIETDIEKGGRILFLVHGNKLLTSEIMTEPVFDHVMTAKYIPNVNVLGAYFDGRHVYPISEGWEYYSFDPADREILVDIKPDKEKYAPGDTAKVKITAKDKNNKPLDSAAVSLSVVDEAAFAVADQFADPLEYIYSDIRLPWAEVYYSYVQHTLDADNSGEKGGGGDEDYIRKDFKDTAAFFNVTTDSNGEAELEFKLPDNITSWRLTAQAIWEKQTDAVYAGASRSPLIATQPVFISPIVMDSYVEGDDISVSARCYGETEADETITVTLSGNGIEKTLTAPSGRSANFGKLPAGEYKILFTAENEKGRDAVELPVTVTDSLLEMDIIKSFDLADGIDIKPLRYPVKMTFYDKEYMLYTDTLFKLLEHTTERLDTRIANEFAYKEFGFITEEEFVSEFKGIMQNGAARLLPESYSDDRLTAIICLAAPELADKQAVLRHMTEILDEKDQTAAKISSAYLALAALDQPVMNEIREILENTELKDEAETECDYLYEDMLILCAALAASGDYDGAAKYYEKLVSSEAVIDGEKVYIKGEASLENTQYALLTASMLHRPEADMMARWLLDEEQIYDTFVLELMVYLNNYTVKTENGAEFTYVRDGKTETVKPASHFGTRLSFTEKQLAEADFKVTAGEIFTVVFYKGRIEENSAAPTLKVTKKIRAEKGGQLRIGGEARVDIDVEGGGYHVITDVIPSCGRMDSYSNFKSQQIRLYTDKYGHASYTFKIAADGEYVLESAAALNRRNKTWGISERTVIKVKGYEAAV